MLINADFSRRATVDADAYQWVASPQGGVERVMLDRVGGERALATSIVRYLPGAHFPEHAHPGGEEILVLSGTFSDEGGDFPAGWYLRNPPGSLHRPSSRDGALIFVKLWQMSSDETVPLRIDTGKPASWRRTAGAEVCPLYSSASEEVVLRRVAGLSDLTIDAARGAEVLVLTGDLQGSDVSLSTGGWLRLPPGDLITMKAGQAGATLYLKTGHLAPSEVH